MRIEKEVLDILEARLANETRQGVDTTDALIEQTRREILSVLEIKMNDDLDRLSKEFASGVKLGQKWESRKARKADTESTEEEVEEAVAAEEEPDGKDDTDEEDVEGDEDGYYEDTEGGPNELFSDEELYEDDFVDALEGDGTVAASRIEYIEYILSRWYRCRLLR